MLLKRSICLQIFLLLVVNHVKCQEEEYSVDEDHEDFAEHPDYSKYYSVDNSAPLVSSPPAQNSESYGFVNPIEFSSGFFGLDTAPSNKQTSKENIGFVPQQKAFPEFYSNEPFSKDFFEESQKQQAAENEQGGEESSSELNAGPNYISYKLPAKGDHSDEVENISDTPYNSRKQSKKDYDDEIEEDVPSSKKYKSDYDYDSAPVKHNKYTDYNIGKSSSTVSQYPQAQGLYTNIPTTTLTPYQKYSFQPVSDGFDIKPKFLDTLISTVAPFNPSYTKVAPDSPSFETQQSENVPQQLKGMNCRKITKPVSEKNVESMNCYVCQEPGTKSKHTQCSYTSEPKPTSYYKGTSERYSTPSRDPDGFRYKRYSGNEDSDPYEYVKERSQKVYDQPAQSENQDYSFTPYYDAETVEKSFSELQSEEIAKHPENCHKVEKSGMTCTICKNAKTGGNFEQCSYTSEPKEQKYAYVTEKKYDSQEHPEESKPVSQTKQPEKTNERVKTKKLLKTTYDKKTTPIKDFEPIEEYEGRRKNNKRPERNYDDIKLPTRRRNEESRNDRDVPKENSRKLKQDNHYDEPRHYAESTIKQKKNDENHYDIPHHFAESTIKQKKTGGKGLEPSLYGSDDSGESSESNEKVQEYKDLDEYHFKLFPEFSNAESRQEQTQAATPEYTAEGNRQDVEEVLAEFSKKDRSNCKKAEKNGMTCYLCVDQNKIQHEECMFVSESKPKATHVAYHELQKIKTPESTESHSAESKQQPELVPAASEDSKRKRFFKKVTTPIPLAISPSASDEFERILAYKPTKPPVKKSKKQKNQPKKAKEQKTSATEVDSELLDEDGDPQLETPSEFVVGEKEGAFSAETKPVYSKTLGVKLPKFMLVKSEFEKEFDEFSGTG